MLQEIQADRLLDRFTQSVRSSHCAAARVAFVKCLSLSENFLLRSESETRPDAEEAALALRNTSSLHDSARLLAPTVNLQLLNGCYKLMVTFQMSNAHTNDYTNK